MCSGIHSEVTQLIEDIKERYKVNISFKLHFKCSDGYYFKDTFEYENLIIEKKCFCIQHKQMHRSDQILSPWMNNEVKEIPDRTKINTTQDDQNPENKPSKEDVQDQTSVKTNLPVSVNLRKQLNIKQSTNENLFITSCIKTGNTLVFTDWSNRRLIICNSDGTDIHHIPLSYRPRYIREIDSNTVAVSCMLDNTILIINISTRSVTITIKTSGSCRGISYNDNNLYGAIGGSIIHVMDLTGKVIHTIPAPTDAIIDITVDRGRLVCIDKTSIYCCSLDGKLMWKIEMDLFQDLTRITTDNEGNVYVTLYYANTVTVVSDDGKHHRELLTKSDGLKEPYGIYFDKKENILLLYSDKTSIYCCSLDGKSMWNVYKNDEIQYLQGVTTDDEGNVYVTNASTNTVIVVSDDCEHYKELLTESDGLDRPFGIYFDKTENILLVCNERDGNAFLFDVIKKLT
ncbi:unnamed protein product [Mytilus edulis]|uniref:Uncharacterized protein n=1 Tax=Mytilus edulis TaxID=6550 RepID=A0A8S3V2D0_MYTED|nr:unnamed protein product [Mytilus edulis]